MSVQNIQKKIMVSLMLISIFLSGNCFGNFSLVKKIYEVNSGLTLGQSGKIGGVFKSIFMIVFLMIPVYGISAFIDVILFNVIEFWTDKNPLAENNKVQEIYSDKSTVITKKISGNRMDLTIKNNDKVETIVLFRDKPQKFFVERNSKLEEIKIESVEFGSLTIFSANTSNGVKNQIIPTQVLEINQSKILTSNL